MLSLPPKVSGVVNGHLIMKVDEVMWSQKPIDDVLAVVMWWGGETSTTFRPVNIARYATTEETTDVVYEIRTSLPLFEKYLKKCGTLRIVVTDAEGVPVGIVRIPEIHNIIHVSPYENYFPILSNTETRIGDLHVVFQLVKFKEPGVTNIIGKKSVCLNKKKNHSVILDDSLSNPLHSSCETKYQNAKKTTSLKEQGIPQTSGFLSRNKSGEMAMRSNYRSRSRDIRRTSTCRREIYRTTASDPEKSQDKSEIGCKNKKKLSCDDLDEIFSQILQQGQKLQKAITLSVIEDELSGGALSDPVLSVHCHCDAAVAPEDDHISKCSKNPMTGDSKSSDKMDSLKEKRVSLEDKNKVIHYLQGKTMSTKDENEALVILRGMSPTEGFLHELKDYCLKPAHERNKIISEESLIMDESNQDDLITQKSVPDKSRKPAGWLPLHRVNCVRLSIIKLVLNSVGFKRVNASFSSKEILFNDFATHSVAALSERDATNVLVTLLSKVAFRVCARQINQRVPIILGEASLMSISDLLNSASLSQEFLAPVVSPEGIFVASLNVRVELGKDRIQFGGPVLPSGENIARKLSEDADDPTPRRASSSRSSVEAGASKACSHDQPSSLDQPRSCEEIRTCNQQPRQPTGPQQTEPILPIVGVSCAEKGRKSKSVGTSKCEFVNHDLAITVQRVSDCHAISGLSPQNVHFIVAYRFPCWDATKLTTIEWQDFSTDPAMCKEDLHFFGANRVHSSLLPGSETFHSFLKDAIQVRGAVANDGIQFLLFCRTYYPKISDSPTGMAVLPLDTISTLEAAFVDAAANNAHFTESSCASVIMDLPLQRIRNNTVVQNEQAIGILHLKLDYRHTYVRPVEREGSGDSQLDPHTEENVRREDAAHLVKHPWSLAPNIKTINAMHLPNIAVAIHNIGKIVEKYPFSAWIDKESLNDRDDGAAPSKRIETVFVTDPSDSFGRTVDPLYKTLEEQSKSLRGTRRTDNEPKSFVLEQNDPLPGNYPEKNVGHAGTRIEVATSSSLPECRHIGLQTSPFSGIRDVAVEVEDAQVCRGHMGSREPVKSCNASTSTDPPLQNDRELQTTLQGRTTSSQTTESLMNLDAKAEIRESSKENVGNSCRLSRQVAQLTRFSTVDCNSDIEAVTKQSSADSETLQEIEDDSDEAVSHPTEVEMEDSIKRADIPDRDAKAALERPLVDTPKPAPESPRISECERNLMSRKQPIESTKRRAPTSVIQSSRSNSERLAVESDRGVAGGDKSLVSPLMVAPSSVITIPTRVEVECALHLPEWEQDNTVTFVTVHSDRAESGHEILRSVQQLITPLVASRTDVYWNWSCQVDMPTALLLEEERRLIFKVWQRKGKSGAPQVLGIAAVDLTVLAAGLPVIDGWFNILDISGNSQGQIKVLIAPLRETLDLSLPRRTFQPGRRAIRSFERVSYYVAQGMFKNFPSHLTNHDDILVQKVQSILGLCDGSGCESLKNLDTNPALTDEIALTEKDTLSEEASGPLEFVGQKENFALLKYLEKANTNAIASSEVGNEISHTGNLRETVAELERLTSKMRERIRVVDTTSSNLISPRIFPKQHSPLQSKSGKCAERTSTAQERVHAWECESAENLYVSHSPEKIPTDTRSRPHGKFAQYGRCAGPLWEQLETGEEGDIGADAQDEVISEWIADAAVRGMVNMAQLFLQDIVVVPRKDVQVIELDGANEAIVEVPARSEGTPNNSEELTASLTENANGVRSPANEADSGVDVDHSSTLSRRNTITDQQRIDDQQMYEDQRMTVSRQNSQLQKTKNEQMERFQERENSE